MMITAIRVITYLIPFCIFAEPLIALSLHNGYQLGNWSGGKPGYDGFCDKNPHIPSNNQMRQPCDHSPSWSFACWIGMLKLEDTQDIKIWPRIPLIFYFGKNASRLEIIFSFDDRKAGIGK